MPQKRKPPTDHTGAKREHLEREHAEELKRRQGEMAMAARVAAETDEVVDYGPRDGEMEIMVADGPEDVVEQPWETVGDVPAPRGSDGTVVIRINTNLDEVTIGAGNNYTFMEGGQYRVPIHVAEHLEEKGYVWH